MKKKVCPRCGVERTRENTYIRGNGHLCGYCKDCEKTVTKIGIYRRMGQEERDRLRAKHESILSMIEEADA
jgi:hypothetical protein